MSRNQWPCGNCWLAVNFKNPITIKYTQMPPNPKMIALLMATILMSQFIVPCAIALKILFVQPNYLFFTSHFGFSLSLAKFLAGEGHEIHMLIPITNERGKTLHESDEHRLNVRYFVPKKTTSLETIFLKGGGAFIDRIYTEIVEDFGIMGELRAEKFDVGVAEAFTMTEYSLALFHFLQIPVTIATHSQPIVPFQLYLLGVLSKMKQADTVPMDFIGLSSMNITSEDHFDLLNMQSKEEMDAHLKLRRPEIWKHCVNQTLAKVKEHLILDTEYQKLAAEKYHLNFPGLDAIFVKSRFFFVNSLPEMDIFQSKIVKGVEKVKFIGGFNLGLPTEIDEKAMENTNSLIDLHLGGKEGVILVSFGTVVDTASQKNANMIEALAETMGNFPNFLFIWKLAKEAKRGTFKWNNVITQSWVNQKELLAHPKTKAFVSHCGMNSVLESVFYGVPTVCVPFFGDQYYNAEVLAFQRIGLAVEQRHTDKLTMQMQLTTALSKALGCRQKFHSGAPFNLNALKAVSAAFRQRNGAKIIADAMKEIEREIRQQ